MKKFTYEHDGQKITLLCNSRSTRNGFAHDCTFLLNGHEENRASCHYLNRTWEGYECQSVILKAVGEARAFTEDRLISRFKDSHGYMRMNEKRYGSCSTKPPPRAVKSLRGGATSGSACDAGQGEITGSPGKPGASRKGGEQ